jgi:DNA-binding CsgD family transcriptional regulator
VVTGGIDKHRKFLI